MRQTKSLLNVLILTMLVFTFACKKDLCKEVTCQNGGTCNEGVCDCPDGYSGAECATYDPCHDVICENEGTCNDGTCTCAEEWTGTDCSDQKTPNKILITKVTVTAFPGTDGGTGWDPASDPDIYPIIYKGATLIFNPTQFYTDADSNTSYSWDLVPAGEITSPLDLHKIDLYDDDSLDDNDLMASITFTPYNDTNLFPSELVLSEGALAVTIKVSYEWD